MGKTAILNDILSNSKGGKRGRGSENKSIVAGVVERQGSVITQVVPNVQAKTLLPFIEEKVIPETMVCTDELPSYNQLLKSGVSVCRSVNHIWND